MISGVDQFSAALSFEIPAPAPRRAMRRAAGHEAVLASQPHDAPDLAGIEQGGYKLVFTDKPTKSARTIASAGGRRGGGIDAWYSIGIRVNREGDIADVRWNGPADKAKLFPGQKIIAVNGNVFSGEALRAAIKDEVLA